MGGVVSREQAIERVRERGAMMDPPYPQQGEPAVEAIVNRAWGAEGSGGFTDDGELSSPLDDQEREAEIVALLTRLASEHDIGLLEGAIPTLSTLSDMRLDELKVQLAEVLGKSFKPRTFDRAVRNERDRRQHGRKVAVARRRESAGAILPNYTDRDVVGANGKVLTVRSAVPIEEIRRTLAEPDDWPRRVGRLLFVEGGGAVRYLETADALFAWLHEHYEVRWAAGQDGDGRALVTKAELLEQLQAVATECEAVEALPHEPRLPGHHYTWKPPKDYAPTGEHLEALLGFFDNPETDADGTLIKAALMTPAWGGQPGRRPAFAIMAPDRGCGKSTLASVIGQLYGNPIELSVTASAEDRLVPRLLTPEALTRRVVRIDNLKGGYASAFIEALITTPIISGHRLYCGEASRPNTLTFVMTSNALRLSRDIADRTFIIRLARPDYRPEWERDLYSHLTEHRDHILADIVAILRQPSGTCTKQDRYAEWVSGVLAKAGGDTEVIVELNQERRNQCDEELLEAELIMEAIDDHIAPNRQLGATGDGSAFISSSQMVDLVSVALKKKLSAKGLKSRLDVHCQAGRLPRIQHGRNMSARGYHVQIDPERCHQPRVGPLSAAAVDEAVEEQEMTAGSGGLS